MPHRLLFSPDLHLRLRPCTCHFLGRGYVNSLLQRDELAPRALAAVTLRAPGNPGTPPLPQQTNCFALALQRRSEGLRLFAHPSGCSRDMKGDRNAAQAAGLTIASQTWFPRLRNENRASGEALGVPALSLICSH